ncbi:MAG: hypothetical protein LBE21_06475 [Pseudomonadales bacterium]|jgi:hypothetical protein|nr:hypothetical protein [Pseudomonadales bacterium]
MSLTIDYRLLDAGWAECTVQTANASQELSASDLSDALRNLVLAAVAILAGLRSVATSFDEEPGEYRWVLEYTGGLEISLKILLFNELWGNKPDSEGEILIQTTCHLLEFAEAVANAASRVLEKYGIQGYAEKWPEHEFPSRELNLLNEYIAQWKHNLLQV